MQFCLGAICCPNECFERARPAYREPLLRDQGEPSVTDSALRLAIIGQFLPMLRETISNFKVAPAEGKLESPTQLSWLMGTISISEFDVSEGNVDLRMHDEDKSRLHGFRNTRLLLEILKIRCRFHPISWSVVIRNCPSVAAAGTISVYIDEIALWCDVSAVEIDSGIDLRVSKVSAQLIDLDIVLKGSYTAKVADCVVRNFKVSISESIESQLEQQITALLLAQAPNIAQALNLARSSSQNLQEPLNKLNEVLPEQARLSTSETREVVEGAVQLLTKAPPETAQRVLQELSAIVGSSDLGVGAAGLDQAAIDPDKAILIKRQVQELVRAELSQIGLSGGVSAGPVVRSQFHGADPLP